jgi:hypothetical protein
MAVKRHRTHYDITAANRTDAAMAAVEKNMHRVERASARMGQTFQAVLGATGAITLGRAMAQEVMQFERESMRLNAVIRATGGAAGVTRDELESMAQSIGRATTFDAGDLVMAQSELMKFGNIHGNVFRGALQLSADLAAFMGTEVPDAAAMIGKSLQSPTEGITQMERQFGKLTEAQRSHIEQLVEQGRAVEAQNAILDLWKQKIGGTAELMNTGLTGAVAAAGEAWRDLLEDFGKMDATGGLVERRLRGIAEILDHIRQSSAPATGGEQRLERMVALQEQIDAIEGQIRDRERGPRPERFADGIAAARAQVAALKKELMAINQVGLDENRLRRAQQEQADFEASLAVGQTPVTLGGRTAGGSRGGGAAKPAGDADGPLKAYLERQKEIEEANRQIADAVNEPLVQSAELATQAADALVYTWDEAGNRVAMTREEFERLNEVQLETEDAIGKAARSASDFGFTFNSALEDAILNGGKLSDVLKAVEQDIGRMLLRKAVTEPLGDAVGGLFKNLDFGSIFSSSPGAYTGSMAAFDKGTDYVPKTGLAIIHKGEAIIPASQNNGGGGNITFAPVYNVDSRSDRATVMADLERMTRASEARLIRQMRYRSGAVGRALEGQ